MTITNARVEWREDGLPYATDFEDVYFSRDDATGESSHVFLAGNALEERWRALEGDQTFVIGELGFGSGLNFLQVCQLWQRVAPATAKLHYLGFEKHPLQSSDITRLHGLWPQLAPYSAALLAQYPDHSGGCHRLAISANVTLDLHYGDALVQLQGRAPASGHPVDCWFLDGFTPARNPALWDADLFRHVAANSRQGCSLSSYSVAGQVRAALTEAGFEVQKQPGFGRKRHMLQATLMAKTTATIVEPWQRMPPPVSGERSAIVIGAGLAGCSAAYSLARRGWRVTVFDAGTGAATAASGIPQMALRCRLFRSPSPLSEFFLHAFLFAARQFPTLLSAADWHADGVLQLAQALNRPGSDDVLAAQYAPAVLQAITREAASAHAGRELNAGGWLLPAGGWLEPALLCQQYLSHPAINLVTNTRVDSLLPGITDIDPRWSAVAADKSLLAQAGVVVIANSIDAARLSQSSYLPLQAVRGQITELPTNAASPSLRCVVNGERTVFPACTGRHTIAASYSESKTAIEPDKEDDERNITLAAANFVDPSPFAGPGVASQVALRCNSGDRVPIVGALADAQATRTHLAVLTRNARAQLNLNEEDAAALVHRGLYVSIAHGSNGLASCPLSGEIVADLITGAQLPCTAEAMAALNPIRFLIRELKQQKLTSARRKP